MERPGGLARSLCAVFCFTLLLATLAGPPLGAEEVEVAVNRASVSSVGGEANNASVDVSVSADAGLVVFSSIADNLVAGDSNGSRDVFLHEVDTGVTTRISQTPNGTPALGNSLEPAISADGAWVAFSSDATNIVIGDPDDAVSNIFLYEVATGIATRVSTAYDGSGLDGGSSHPSISADGSLIAFSSQASNIVPGDTNGVQDIFLYDVGSDTTVRVSVDSAELEGVGPSYGPAISRTGSHVAYYSYAANLVADDTNDASDIFLRDLTAGTTVRVSKAAGTGDPNPSGRSGRPSLSDDGTKIAFTSTSSNLVEGDTNQAADVFVYSTVTESTTRVSIANDGTQANESSGGGAIGGGGAEEASGGPVISGDGSTVAFTSLATNLVDDDTNSVADVFAYDFGSNTVSRVSVDATGAEADGASLAPALSLDGTTVAFQSQATNLVADDLNGASDVFVASVINRGPIVGALSALVSESAPPGTAVGTVSAIDPDGEAVTFTLTGGNDAGLFTIAPTGEITTAALLDYETTPVHLLTVTGSDGSLVDEAVATITILNVNEAPSAIGFTANVAEDLAAGTVIGTVTGNDPDGDDLRFAITGGNSGTVFAINSSSGELRTTTSLDYEAVKKYTLTVTASDASLSGSATVTVNVTDVFEPGGGAPGDPDPDDPEYNPFDDDDGSIFENDIEWLALSGITEGCGVRLFCPKLVVTRGQMAAFLNRALSLPPASQDYFTDDDDSIFHDDINRLAQSGITRGCGAISFCPDSPVTREQMAAFLVRAFGYDDDGGGDLFEDDDDSIFQDDIDKLATAGVTLGCNPPLNSNFCPSNDVTREQMAAFLRRALAE